MISERKSFKVARFLNKVGNITGDVLQPSFLTGIRKRVDLSGLYNGSYAFLICGGPSVLKLDLSLLKRPGILTMSVNNSVKTFRPNLWTHVDSPDHFIKSIFTDSTIMKFCPEPLYNKYVWDSDKWDWTNLQLKNCPNTFFYERNASFNEHTFLEETRFNWGNSDVLGGGRSVMLVAIKILYVLGVRRVYLLGADFNMTSENTYHFEQSRTRESVSGNSCTYRKLNERFLKLRPIFEGKNFYIFNCNPNSLLQAFPYKSYETAIEESVSRLGVSDLTKERTEGLYDTKKPVRNTSKFVYGKELKPPGVSIITSTGDRPFSFALSEFFVKRQNYKGDIQWVVVDNGKVPMQMNEGQFYIRRVGEESSIGKNLLLAISKVRHDRVLIMEDGDWYSHNWITTMLKELKNFYVVGTYPTWQFNLKNSFCWKTGSKEMSVLASMAFQGNGVSDLYSVCERVKTYNTDSFFNECFRVENSLCKSCCISEKDMYLVQMKGYTRGHVCETSAKEDVGFVKLKSLIGTDFRLYEPMIEQLHLEYLKCEQDGRNRVNLK